MLESRPRLRNFKNWSSTAVSLVSDQRARLGGESSSSEPADHPLPTRSAGGSTSCPVFHFVSSIRTCHECCICPCSFFGCKFLQKVTERLNKQGVIYKPMKAEISGIDVYVDESAERDKGRFPKKKINLGNLRKHWSYLSGTD